MHATARIKRRARAAKLLLHAGHLIQLPEGHMMPCIAGMANELKWYSMEMRIPGFPALRRARIV